MPRFLRIALYILLVIGAIWSVLTFWVQRHDRPFSTTVGDGPAKVLVLFHADPIYDMDEKVCMAFAEGAASNGATVTVMSTAASIPAGSFDLYVFCANTYNWAPDEKIMNAIEAIDLSGRSCFAITLGSGSTERSSEILTAAIKEKGGTLVGSQELWLLRPNDEGRPDDDNVEVARDISRKWGASLAPTLRPNDR